MNLQYRNVHFKYSEWTTYTGSKASGYTCSDEYLLSNTNQVQIASKTIQDIKSQIDHRLDNKTYYKELRDLNNEACAEFYAKPTNYKGD